MVSIIIALYNGEKFILETIDSALAQDTDIEVIVIDDCSTDNSFEVVDAQYKDDSRVHLLKNKINRGFCKTVNIGIKEAKGDYILILDQDDLLSSNHCSILLKYFTNDKIKMVFTDYYLIDSVGNVFDRNPHCKHRDLNIKDFLFNNPVPAPGLIIKTNSLRDVGGYPELADYPNYGEYYAWIRIVINGTIRYCDDVKAYYRRHQNNMTNQFTNKTTQIKLLNYYYICKKQLLISDKVLLQDKLTVIVSFLKDILFFLVRRI